MGKGNEYGSLPTIQREGKAFDGWWTEPEGKGEQIFASTSVPIDEGHILYAKWNDFVVGEIGLAGGYVFYDKGFYSEGWRYLEAAPEGWSSTSSDAYTVFGYHRESSSGTNMTVGTDTAIGSGKANTQALVSAMGVEAYSSSSGSDKATYAAKVASGYSRTVAGVTYNDWFLPSKDELNEMYENLHKKNLGGFFGDYFYYWSSSEYYDDSYYAWDQCFYDGSQCISSRYFIDSVRPVRSF